MAPGGGRPVWRNGEFWTTDDIGELCGRTAVVTGANSGIGFETAAELAGHGAHVILACRNRRAADQAADHIVGRAPAASVRVVALDLASLTSVHRAADEITGQLDRLDVLVDNAGVMATPRRATEDGFELQMGTNHLGHFALTGLLLELLLRTPGSRVVTVSSTLHRIGRFRPDVLRPGYDGPYHRWLAYGDSKLANLLFTYELDRRLTASAVTTLAVAAHPGWARTNLPLNGPAVGNRSALRGRMLAVAGRVGAQSAAGGARPTLYAATAAEVRGGEYFGPAGPLEQFGPPERVRSSRRSHRPEDAARLWSISEEVTGVRYGLPVPVPAGQPS